jgi:hypothetical protein
LNVENVNRDRGGALSIFNFQFSISLLAAAYACHFVVQHATPVDRALPFIAVVVAFVAWAFGDVLLLVAVPLLMLAEIAIDDETMRLVAFGVIAAATLLVPLVSKPRGNSAIAVVIAALLLLRWIPRPDLLLRELAILAIAAAIAFVLGRTPFAVAVAVFAALATPAVPLRTLALPLLGLFVAILARLFGTPRLRLALPSAIALAFALTFFAWSGIVARALPYFLKPARAAGDRYVVNAALSASQSATLPVPAGANALIVSGANVPRFGRGALLGRIEPGNIDVRIGDVADWGYLRRDQFYGARNPLPRDPAGRIREYGYDAWIDGAGRIALPRGARTIRVVADARLPAGASLQVEGFEIPRR